MKKVGVIIVTYNRAAHLRPLIEQVLAQTRPPDEIIVIDNASIDDTPAVVAAFAGVRYVRFPENQGSAGGYREGVRLAFEKNDLSWLLDDDLLVSPDALATLIRWEETLSASESVGALRSFAGTKIDSDQPIRTTGFAWRGALLRKSAAEAVGLPRRDYFLYGEDIEYALRLTRAGYAIYLIPASRVLKRPTEDKEEIRFLGRVTVVYKDAFRLYYATRNQCNIFLEYRDLSNLFRTFLYLAKVIALLGINRQNASRFRIEAIVRGIRDGLTGRLGSNDSYVPTVTRQE